MLREGLELKLIQHGITFKGGKSASINVDSNVDGYLQLVNAMRVAESLRGDNNKLIKSFNELQTLSERKE